MKKILLSLLAVLMLFAFVACDNPSGSSNVKPETGSGSTNNNGTSDNDTENNDSEKIPVEETWVALTSLEGVEGAFRWDALHGTCQTRDRSWRYRRRTSRNSGYS